ncbi:NAD(P)-binding protein [Ceratobasidium sp. AG-I]|nr:NAD(P)-binding protein [Ceratobasidium sp. AG-I]
MSASNSLLKGKKVIVVGGSSGIGKSVAAAALSHGASVVISSSSQARVDTAVASLKELVPGSVVSGTAFNVRDVEAIKSFLTTQGKFDHFVYTAAEALLGTFPHAEIDETTKGQFETRYWAPMTAAQHIHKNNLINPGGSFTMTIGIVFNRPIPGWGLVSGVAGAVESATRGLAMDLKPLRVNTVSPGIVDTAYWDTTPSEVKNDIFEETRKKLLVGHIGSPDEVAEAYIFAMKCSYFTGQVITVDGGGSLV